MKTKINPDIQKERNGSSLNVEEFAVWWNGGSENLKSKREIEKLFLNDPELFNDDELPIEYMSYQDMYDHTVKKFVQVAKKLKKLQNEKDPNGKDYYPGQLTTRSWPVVRWVAPQGSPFMLHASMFISTIKTQGTPEQIQKWVPKCETYEIIGTYAQTELGHGTFLRGLETRADFDRKTDEFVLHSPTITAYKWWPGGLGHTANYAIVAAQLYIDNKSHGIQLFMVPLRDVETHRPLPGITIGEIGNKMAFQTVNNGYLGFEKFRIPRTNMLMKNAQVRSDGGFVKSPASVLTYFSMVQVRVFIVSDSAIFLSTAAAIATRYSAVRRQSKINPNEPECQIMDHLTQQMKLFPEIAKAVVMKINADYMISMFREVQNELLNGNLSRLAELHALSCCLKAITSHDSTAGVENLRCACGGHGYMLASGLPMLYNFATAAKTYEGENTVLYLQTARFLVKAWALAMKGKPLEPTVMYLNDAVKMKRFPHWDGSWECMLRALEYVAANKIKIAFNNLEARKQQNMVPEEAFNATSIELAAAAEMHGRSFLANTAVNQIKALSASEANKAVLNDLIELFLVGLCLDRLSDLLRFIQLTETDISDLQKRLEKALGKIRPNAVAIVDGFDIHDRALKSVLGAYDGNVYERIFESAQKSSMNKIPVQKSFEEHLKPFFRSKM